MLYAGTRKEIPRRPFQKDAPDLSVAPLGKRDTPIKAHFKSPEVQYIGSASRCGCDFPHVTLQNGEWPELALPLELKDAGRLAIENSNRLALVNLLRTTGEPTIELYGIWDGDFLEVPKAREVISLERLLGCNFYFKEQGFYTVEMNTRGDVTAPQRDSIKS